MLRLKEIRTQLGITQDTVAAMLGVSRASYTNIENGKRDPDTATLIALADYFHVPIDFLVGREMKAPAQSLNSEELRVLAAYRAAEATYRKVALELLETHPASTPARQTLA